jgi:hypothetical protein
VAILLCSEAGCTRPKSKHHSRCNYHRNLHEKATDLARWAFRKFRNNVKARREAAPEWKKSHYAFEITLEYFREWCASTEILLGRGIYAESLHIDREIEELGYVPGNLKPLSNRLNVLKEHARRKRVVFDYELYARRKYGSYLSEEEAREDEGKSVFRVIDTTPELALEEAPF